MFVLVHNMKEAAKKRGRPRSFDSDLVIERATETFLHFGYAGASLEQLTAAMGLNKPSLYAAFGDKRSLFMRALEARAHAVAARLRVAFERCDTLPASLDAMLVEAVEIYTGDANPGCMIVNVSTTEALVDEGFASYAREFFAQCDRVLAKWIETRYAPRGVLGAKGLAQIINGVIHDISVRARVGESAAKLREYAHTTAAALAKAAA
jgi:TetR/AcrR family transcriptional regulator, copper-responsive repressor